MTTSLGRRQVGTLVGLVMLGALLTALTPHFLTVSNLLNVTEQTAINAIIAQASICPWAQFWRSAA